MLIVGLTGGIGSGKSHVARGFQALGAAVIEADQMGHAVLEDGPIRDSVVREFGESILGPDGKIDRQRLGKLVFDSSPGSQARLARLESLVHPELERRLHLRLEELRQEGTSVLILDAPVMFRAGWDRICHRLLFVDCEFPLRLERCRRRGWTRADLLARESAQLPLEEKRRRSTDVIDNNRPDDSAWLEGQIRDLWSIFEATRT